MATTEMLSIRHPDKYTRLQHPDKRLSFNFHRTQQETALLAKDVHHQHFCLVNSGAASQLHL